MGFSQVFEHIKNEDLIGYTYRLKRDGYRLVQISNTKKGNFHLIYNFDKNYELLGLCLEIEEGEEIESISGIYPYAFLYENELQDLFGVKISNMSIDFKGNLYKTSVKTPLNTDREQVL